MTAGAFGAQDIILIVCVILLFFFVSFGVFLFVRNGMIWGSFSKLLEEGDYSREEKEKKSNNSYLATIYWCVITACYLGISFYTMRWDRTWVVWPVAGVLFGAVEAVADIIRKK